MYEFGNWLTRLLWGGTKLAPAEQWLLRQLVDNLPPHLKPTVEEQIASYNLAQREVDGRGINLYCKPAMRPGIPALNMVSAEAPLIRVAALAAGYANPIHATLTAVSGRVFCMAFDQPARHLPVANMQLVKVKDAWRSNFPAGAPNNSSKPTPLRGAA